MAALRETIAVVDKSGKVVSTSKHLFGVFREARNAYRERKATIQAEKQAKIAEREARRALATFAIDDRRSGASSRQSGKSRTSQRHHSNRHHHPDVPRGSRYEQDLHNEGANPPNPKLIEYGRRHTAHDIMVKEPKPPTYRSKSDGHVDMDLAYGEAHPEALGRYKLADEEELQGLVAKAKMLLEEADCMQHTATATMAHLQKNPDAMAAVALTLAEISTLVSKMAPGIVASLKLAAPSVFALLASPQFLIAAGVGIGVTIVMFGGYKIIKKITDATQDTSQVKAPEATANELFELQDEHLSQVEMWRRGVADAEASSVGTSVDGEFMTPTAAAMSGIDLPLPSKVFRAKDEASTASSRRSRRSHRSRTSTRSGEEKKRKEKPKKSSKLRLMFTV